MGNSSGKQLKERFQRAKATKTLSLERCDLGDWGKLQKRLEGLEDIRSLDLGDNKLRGPVPQTLAAFQSLKNLSLSGNAVTCCRVVSQLAALEDLSVARSAVAEVPDLQTVVRLKQLDMSRSAVARFASPQCFGGLRQLRVVNLSHNRIQLLPPSLLSLPVLSDMDLSHNQLQGMGPDEKDGAGLPQLQRLDLTGNGITELPRWLFTDTRLNQLCLDGNPLTIHQLRDRDYTAAWQERQKAAIDKQMHGGLVVKLN
eukprot:TRINITY_DN18_c0_g3_i1.p1 TRINITY_DN18_c0_g3~~TRINITY_DN18_c0_g3_i1.p1  ORF type:complete len:256 (+),score=92.90 TRINITY_DN18_c0_g3_i1:52-819(+)